MLEFIKIILAIMLLVGVSFVALFIVCAIVLNTIIEEREKDKK